MFTVTMRLALTAAILAAMVAPPQAGAVSKRYYGMNWDRQFSLYNRDVLGREWTRMDETGVGSVRAVFSWASAQSAEDAEFDFWETDPLVAEAARNDLALLPIILRTPPWARKYADREGSPPRSPRGVTRYLAALVDRYGPDGTFWLANPTLPKRPVREWQIWNEPELSSYWNESSSKKWKGYAKLVRAADATLREKDRGARLILAGLTGKSWRNLGHIYENGAKGHFDAVALHPYTGSVEEVAEVVRRNRVKMERFGDGKRAVWITELSWPAAKGRMEPPAGIRRIVTDDEGMARRLRSAYRYFRGTKKRGHRVARIYWYTWGSTYAGKDDVFDYAGLLRLTRDGDYEPKPALEAFRAVAP